MFEILVNAKIFFDLLPKDWQDSIVPYWRNYSESAKVYVLKKDGEICAGGIVFNSLPPEMEHFRKEVNYWLKRYYLYIGFIWVPEDKRKQNYGFEWLFNLKRQNPAQKFWLTTEEKQLKSFYIKNGFRYEKTLFYNEIEEDLFLYDAV